MSDKPKLWNGPSPVGEGAARGNEISGAPYQTHIAPGVISRKMGVFSEVVKDEPQTPITDEPTVFASGRCDDNPDVKFREAVAYDLPFKSSRTLAYTPVGFNYANNWQLNTPPVTWEFTFRQPHRPNKDITVSTLYLEGNGTMDLYYKKTGVATVGQPISTTVFAAPPGVWTQHLHQRIHSIPVGRVDKDNQPRILTIAPYTNSTLDPYNFTTSRWAFNLLTGDKKALPSITNDYSFQFPSGSAASDFDVVGCACVTPEEFIVFIVEYPSTRTGSPDEYEDARYQQVWYSSGGTPTYGVVSYESMEPRVWMFRTTNSGLSWMRTQMSVFEEHVSAPQKANGQEMWSTQPLFGFPEFEIMFNSETGYVPFLLSFPKLLGSTVPCMERANDLGGSFEVVIMSRRKWLILFNIVDARIYGTGFIQARSYILRTEDAGANWVSLDSPLTSTISASTPSNTDYTFAGTTLRDGVVVIRCAQGREGFDRELRFLRSRDYGETWNEFTPTGLPEVRSDKLGYLKVLKVYEDNGVAKTLLALPAWVPTDSGGEYRIYLSTDDGDTWEKGRKIASSSRHWRLDHDKLASESNTYSDNFGTLDVRGPERKPESLDIALPWRYDGEIAPPAS